MPTIAAMKKIMFHYAVYLTCNKKIENMEFSLTLLHCSKLEKANEEKSHSRVM